MIEFEISRLPFVNLKSQYPARNEDCESVVACRIETLMPIISTFLF